MNCREDEHPIIHDEHTPICGDDDDDSPAAAPTPHPPSPGCCGRVARVLQGVTVEPVLFLYVLGTVMMGSVTTNLLLDKECQEKGYHPEVCNNLTAYKTEEAVVQQAVTTMRMYLELITSLPSVLFSLFLGSWSDRHGRKVPLVLPLAGNAVATLVYVANAYFMSIPATYILFAALPVALTGGLTTLLMASFSYISDITRLQARTTRIAFLSLGFGLGSPVGLSLSDLLYYKVGYLGVYGTGEGLLLLAILYAILWIKDTRGQGTGGDGVCGGILQSPVEHARGRKMCQDLFDTENVRMCFATAFKRRPDKGRAKVLCLIAALCIMVAEFGSSGMDYLYTKRVFGWTYNQYVQLNVTQVLIHVVVVSVLLPLLSYRLQVADAALVLVGCVSKVMGFLAFGLAPQPWFLYLSCLISSAGNFSFIITRSLISKVVPPDELGRVFSLLASAEAVIPLASGPLYTAVYNSSLTVFPGAIYFLGASLYTVAGAIILWVFLNRHPSSFSTTTTTITTSTPSTLPTTQHIHADGIPDIEAYPSGA